LGIIPKSAKVKLQSFAAVGVVNGVAVGGRGYTSYAGCLQQFYKGKGKGHFAHYMHGSGGKFKYLGAIVLG
jgi:hypothetical protein